MMDNIKRICQKYGAGLSMFLTSVLTGIYYLKIIFNSNIELMCPGSDSLKNFFTLRYYVEHDTGSWFTGMNHPYGEHIVFTDAQPLLAFIFKLIYFVYPPITEHIQEGLIYILFIVLILTAWIIYRIMRELDIPAWIAVLTSPLIVMMSPQIYRFSGHFGLGYTCFIPLLIWLLIRWWKTNDIYYICNYFLIILLFSFLHLYFLAIGILISLAYTIASILFKKGKILPILIGSALCFIIVKLYMHCTDPIQDRPTTVYGITAYCSQVQDILFSKTSLTTIIPRIFHFEFNFEGYGYIGFFALAVSILALLFYKTTIDYFKKNPLVLHLLTTLFITLLAAFAFPLTFSFLIKYYEMLPAAIKQFRSVGRFSWIFYYGYTTLCVHYMYYFINSLRTSQRKYFQVFFVVIGIFWIIDMNMYSNAQKHAMNEYRGSYHEETQKPEFLADLKNAGYETKDFQSILYYPYTHLGTEKITFMYPNFDIAEFVSFYTNLPIIGATLSRSSFSQMSEMVNVFYSEEGFANIQNQLPNDTNLLVIIFENNIDSTNNWILEYCDSLFSKNEITYYKLNIPNAIQKNDSILLSKHNNIDTVATFNIDFKDLNIPTHSGKTAKITKENMVIDSAAMPINFADYKYLTINIWAYADKIIPALQRPRVILQNKENSELYNYELYSKDIIRIDNRWVNYQIKIPMKKGFKKILLNSNMPDVIYDDLTFTASDQ